MNSQLSLIAESAVEWDSDSWETPDWLAQKMADLVMESDRRILEPFAGTGQIAKYLPQHSDAKDGQKVFANEIKRSRFKRGTDNAQNARWECSDFIAYSHQRGGNPFWSWFDFDLIITNPPFSLAIASIAAGLRVLDRYNPDSRLLYLLPGDTFASKERNAHFQALDCHIYHRYEVVGRVAYLKQGVPQQGRQIQDAVFDIRPGKARGCVTFT